MDRSSILTRSDNKSNADDVACRIRLDSTEPNNCESTSTVLVRSWAAQHIKTRIEYGYSIVRGHSGSFQDSML